MQQQGLIITPEQVRHEEREAGLAISTGYQGTGKSYQTLFMFKRYLALHATRKGLIYDINDEFGYENCAKHGWPIAIQKLPPDLLSIQRFTAHQTERFRRIVPIDPKTGTRFDIPAMKDMLKLILQTFTSGMLLIEDMNKYLLQVRHMEEIVSTLISLRHQNLDGMIHLQSLAKIDPTLWENTKYIRMHWQTDNIDRIVDRIPNAKLVQVAKLIVDDHYYVKNNKRFFLWVLPQQNKLYGAFSRADFKLGLYRYFKMMGKAEFRDTCDVMQKSSKKIEDRIEVMNMLFQKHLYMYGNAA